MRSFNYKIILPKNTSRVFFSKRDLTFPIPHDRIHLIGVTVRKNDSKLRIRNNGLQLVEPLDFERNEVFLKLRDENGEMFLAIPFRKLSGKKEPFQHVRESVIWESCEISWFEFSGEETNARNVIPTPTPKPTGQVSANTDEDTIAGKAIELVFFYHDNISKRV